MNNRVMLALLEARVPSAWLLSCFMMFVCSFASADSANMRASLFSDVDESLKTANEARANILSPNSYSEGTKLYISAEDLLKRGKNIEKIRRNLDRANAYFIKSIESAGLSKATLTTALQAREDADAAQANIYAKELWMNAERVFSKAASAVEVGNIKKAKKYAAKAEAEYRDVELAAIKVNYLDDTRKIIAKAKKSKVDRVASKTLQRAENLLSKAETGLTKNRYDTDESRLLAKQAHYEAKHAIYIAKIVNDLNDEAFTAEDFILQSEQPVVDIASALDLVAQFDEGLSRPTKEIRQQIASLRQDSQELADSLNQINTLEAELKILSDKFGVQSQRLAKQEEFKQRLRQVESLFTPAEAIVMSQGGNLLIRTIGLNFGSGSDQINSRNFSLLKKVQQALRLFPNSSVLIEGHTDSFGSDSINLTLSEKRAQAVKAYLMANMAGGESMKINSVGYGEARPIGNNETKEGRMKNRRIDLLIVQAK